MELVFTFGSTMNGSVKYLNNKLTQNTAIAYRLSE
jgi:hypothetical protein